MSHSLKYICVMNENDGGRWGQNIALYIIAGVILVALFIWLCHKSGEDKANLAGAVQSVTSRVNAIEPAVTANANNIIGLSNSVARANQSIKFIGEDFAMLYEDAFITRNVKDFQMTEAGILTWWESETYKDKVSQEREQIIDDADSREWLKFWRANLRRAKRYWSMDSETLDAIQDGHIEDEEEE